MDTRGRFSARRESPTVFNKNLNKVSYNQTWISPRLPNCNSLKNDVEELISLIDLCELSKESVKKQFQDDRDKANNRVAKLKRRIRNHREKQARLVERNEVRIMQKLRERIRVVFNTNLQQQDSDASSKTPAAVPDPRNAKRIQRLAVLRKMNQEAHRVMNEIEQALDEPQESVMG